MLGGALTGGVLLRWVALAAPLWLALTAGRLCYGRLPDGPPPTIAGLAVAPVSITAASCNRSGLWRSSLSLECERHHGKVLVAEPLIDYLLPFVSQARKGGEAVVAGRLQGEAYVLERERQSELGGEVVLGDALQLGRLPSPTRAGCPRGLP